MERSKTRRSPPRPAPRRPVKRRWRDYATLGGRRPVKEFLTKLSKEDRTVIAAAMRQVRVHGTRRSRHLRGDIYEVRAFAGDRGYRMLFSVEGRLSQVLLSLHAFGKQTQGTPPGEMELAEKRLRDWRERGRRGRSADMPDSV